MSFKLQKMFYKRIPLVIFLKDNTVIFQQQIDIAKDDGLRGGTYCAYYKADASNAEEVGSTAKKILTEFQEIGDFSFEEFKEIHGVDFDEYEKQHRGDGFLYFDVKNNDEVCKKYDDCFLDYRLEDKKYTFIYSWTIKRGANYYKDFANALGREGLLTFDYPLEFIEIPEPKKLGEMILEALERSIDLRKAFSGKKSSKKDIEIFGRKFTVQTPNERHFTDLDDGGLAEMHQLYSYFSKGNSESSADFAITCAPELNCSLCAENISCAWGKMYGKADEFEIREVQCGIFNLCAEMKNTKIHKISYYVYVNEHEIIECTMLLHQPNRRKKLDEKLTGLFEEFARQCKFKN